MSMRPFMQVRAGLIVGRYRSYRLSKFVGSCLSPLNLSTLLDIANLLFPAFFLATIFFSIYYHWGLDSSFADVITDVGLKGFIEPSTSH